MWELCDALAALGSWVTPHPLPHVLVLEKQQVSGSIYFPPLPYYLHYLLLVQFSYSTANAPGCSIFISFLLVQEARSQ